MLSSTQLAYCYRARDNSEESVSLRSRLALALVGGDVFKATEDLQGGVSLNAILLAQLRLLCAVNFDELNVLLLQGRGGLLVFWGEGLAVAAPWGKDWTSLVSCGINATGT